MQCMTDLYVKFSKFFRVKFTCLTKYSSQMQPKKKSTMKLPRVLCLTYWLATTVLFLHMDRPVQGKHILWKVS